MDKQSWKFGKEITSEEEYRKQSRALAEELQRIYTPEQVAEIAAQHMLYVDVLNREPATDRGFHSSNDHYRSLAERNNLLSLKFQTLVSNTASIITLGVEGALQRGSKKANDVNHKANRDRKAEAMQDWDKSGLTNMSEFARRNHITFGVTERVLCKWLSDHEKAKRKNAAKPL